MKKFFLCFTRLMSCNLSFANIAPTAWDDPAVSEEICSKVVYHPITHQSIMKIKIEESGEKLIDLLEIHHPRLIPLASFDEKYKNTYEGWSKVREGVYKRLLKMLEELPENVGIAYFEGLRTLTKQKEYFDKKFLETLQLTDDKEQAYQETTKHVSPFIDNIPTHATGAAIDITLFTVQNGKNSLMDMGKFDVIFGPNDQQESFSSNTSVEQRKNRILLYNAAIKAGLANYGFEWWHFSYGDKMHAIAYNQPYAVYGLATNKDDPILSMTKDQYFKQMRL